jgi:hypothetical protein
MREAFDTLDATFQKELPLLGSKIPLDFTAKTFCHNSCQAYPE